jgi:glucosamine--fructose-6-phosphate aminotransferase (isomerizing)
MQPMIDKLNQAGAETLLITDKSNLQASRMGVPICIPARLNFSGDLPEEVYTPIPYIIPAQMLAALLAVEKGLDPDQPRMLSKVTRTL